MTKGRFTLHWNCCEDSRKCRHRFKLFVGLFVDLLDSLIKRGTTGNWILMTQILAPANSAWVCWLYFAGFAGVVEITQLNTSEILYYYTSDSMWKNWLVESIQSIHNSLWTWHDKCNICCRYCIYHIKFKVWLVTKPFGAFSSETKWLKSSLLFLRMNSNELCEKCIIKQLLNSVFAWYHELV